jgi:hypothetical protein
MGADMCVAILAVRSGTSLCWAAAENAIGDLSPEMIEQIGDEFGLDSETIDEELRDALAAVRSAVEDWHRESTTVDFGDWRLLLSGGLSTGDGPTYLYDQIMLLETGGIAAAAGFSWPVAEAAKPNDPHLTQRS